MTNGDIFYFLVHIEDVLRFSVPNSELYKQWRQAFDYVWNDCDTDLDDASASRYSPRTVRHSPGTVSRTIVQTAPKSSPKELLLAS